MSPRPARATATLALGATAVLAAACTDPFEPRSLVQNPRVLAIVAEPPEAAPGQDVRLTALVADPDERAFALRWRVCARRDSILGFSSMQYGEVRDDRGCRDDSGFFLELATDADGSTTLPGAVTEVAFDRLEAAAAAYGELIPADTLRRILDTAGLPLAVELEALDGDEIVARAFKRVNLTRREERGTNPPPPRFTADGEQLAAVAGAAPFACAPAVEPTLVRRNAEVQLAPDPDVDAWLETFPVIDVRGQVQQAREGAYYAWFSTGGRFSRETTHAPDATTRWRAPDEPGPYPLWLVVRDGHGGTSACRAELLVGVAE